MRLQARQRRARHPLSTTLSRTQEYPPHSEIHRTDFNVLQRFLEGLIAAQPHLTVQLIGIFAANGDTNAKVYVCVDTNSNCVPSAIAIGRSCGTAMRDNVVVWASLHAM